MSSTFKTLASEGRSLFKDKGSKHFGFAMPVASEEKARNQVRLLEEEHPNANHVCFAYVLLGDPEIERSSDAGEPANSAGPPILNQVKKYGLKNVMVAVVRYFGGTKLGVGGLINAYRTAAEMAISEARVITKEPRHVYRVKAPYSQLSEIHRLMKIHQAVIMEENHTATHYTAKVELNADQLSPFKKSLSLIHEIELEEVT